MSVKQRAAKTARNKETFKPGRTPPFDASAIKPHKYGTGFSTCGPCASAGQASTCDHLSDWGQDA